MFRKVRGSGNCGIYFIAIVIGALALTLAGLLIMQGIGRDSVHVTVVVPDRFRGVIRIVIDAKAEKFRVVDKGIYIKVPESGLLRASGLPEGWMTVKSHYASGKELPVFPSSGYDTDKATSGLVMLRGLGSFSGGNVYDGVTTGPTEEVRYVVGTREDFLKALDQRNWYTSETMVWFDEK